MLYLFFPIQYLKLHPDLINGDGIAIYVENNTYIGFPQDKIPENYKNDAVFSRFYKKAE